MKFEHYAAAPVTLDTQRVYEQRVHFKPRGLWVTLADDEYGWKQWCEDNDFHLDKFTVRHEVVFAEGWEILTVGTMAELEAFDAKYSEPPYPGADYGYPNWERVAEDYDGIIFAPYFWHLRVEMKWMWYSTLDVASGCIWNPEAIESLTVAP